MKRLHILTGFWLSKSSSFWEDFLLREGLLVDVPVEKVIERNSLRLYTCSGVNGLIYNQE